MLIVRGEGDGIHPPRWPPPVIFSWTLPELTSRSTGTGKSPLPTASWWSSGLNAIAEIFPTRTRSTWMTSGYALAVAIFGGFAPFISVWLISTFNSPIAHSFYLIAAAIVSTIVIATLRETAHEPLG